jgi:hypothetical protein
MLYHHFVVRSRCLTLRLNIVGVAAGTYDVTYVLGGRDNRVHPHYISEVRCFGVGARVSWMPNHNQHRPVRNASFCRQ